MSKVTWPFVAAAITISCLAAIRCTPAGKAAANCPTDYNTIVTWSSGTKSETELQFYDDVGLKGRVRIKAQGATHVGDLPIISGDHAYFVANGNTKYDRTDIISVNLKTCETDEFEINQPSVWDQLIIDNVMFTSSMLNGVGHIYAHDLTTGERLHDYQTQETYFPGMTTDGHLIYAFSSDGPDVALSNLLTVIDPKTWKVVRELDISEVGAEVLNAVVLDGRLYFSGTVTKPGGLTPSDRIGVVDLMTFEIDVIRTPEILPHLLATDGKAIYAAHTFMNESFVPYSQFQNVTRLDPATGTMQQINVGAYLKQISINASGSRLTALHLVGESDRYFTVTELANMSAKPRRINIEPPAQSGFHYVASVKGT